VPIEERKRRTKEIIALAQELAAERIAPKLGGRVEVLLESRREGQWVGHTPDYYEVLADGAGRQGQTVWVRVERIEGYTLIGTVEAVKEEPRRVLLPMA
jgi:threonylcarbamoyladenosine tRNA methylthiotransferase MtaB